MKAAGQLEDRVHEWPEIRKRLTLSPPFRAGWLAGDRRDR
jgi:hypothetical protein